VSPTPAPAAGTPKTGPAPKLWLAKTEWDFGRIWWGDPCTTEIEVRNDGDSPLLIPNVRTSCGCTVAKPSKSSLAPGETDRIKLTYDSKKGVVNVSQTATVESNDPANPNATIQIKGEIRNLFEGKPSQQLLFGTLTTDATESQSITLTNNYDKPIHLKLQDLPPTAQFDVKFEEVSPGKEYRLTATTKPPMPPGGRFTEVHLLTGIPDRPEMKVSVNAFVQERISCSPMQVVAFSNQTAQMTRRDIRVNYLKSKPLKVVSVKSSHPDLIKAELQPEVSNVKQELGAFAYHVIKVELPVYDQIPDTGASVEIATDDPETRFQTFTIPVTKQKINQPAASPTPQPKPRVNPPVVKPGAEPVKPASPPVKPGG
jgi:hypothetical protein